MRRDQLPPDEALIGLAEGAAWHSSPGYRRGDGAEVGPHQYILLREQPRLFEILRTRVMVGAGGFQREYAGYRYRYVLLGGYKYWALREVLNRERLMDDAGVTCGTCNWGGLVRQLHNDRCPLCGLGVEPL